MSNKPPKMRSRLGRGLSSLISVSELPPEEEVSSGPEEAAAPAEQRESTDDFPDAGAGRVLEVPTGDIDPNPNQPRRYFDPAALAELAASLTHTGVIQPIVVRQAGDRYELIAGERRLRAAKLAGLSTIPVILREVDAPTQAQMALVENIQRQDLNPLERAAAYRELLNQLGLTQSELAVRLGEDRTQIAHHLRLLDLAPPVQEMVRDGRLSLGHAKLLAGVSDAVEQLRLADLVVSQELSVRNLERVLQADLPAPIANAQSSAADATPHIQQVEKQLSRQLGLRVQVRQGAKKGAGKMVIHYGNLDQFDELMSRLGVKIDD